MNRVGLNAKVQNAQVHQNRIQTMVQLIHSLYKIISLSQINK